MSSSLRRPSGRADGQGWIVTKYSNRRPHGEAIGGADRGSGNSSPTLRPDPFVADIKEPTGTTLVCLGSRLELDVPI